MYFISRREWAFLALVFLYSFIPAVVGLVNNGWKIPQQPQ